MWNFFMTWYIACHEKDRHHRSDRKKRKKKSRDGLRGRSLFLPIYPSTSDVKRGRTEKTAASKPTIIYQNKSRKKTNKDAVWDSKGADVKWILPARASLDWRRELDGAFHVGTISCAPSRLQGQNISFLWLVATKIDNSFPPSSNQQGLRPKVSSKIISFSCPGTPTKYLSNSGLVWQRKERIWEQLKPWHFQELQPREDFWPPSRNLFTFSRNHWLEDNEGWFPQKCRCLILILKNFNKCNVTGLNGGGGSQRFYGDFYWLRVGIARDDAAEIWENAWVESRIF